MLFDYDDFFNWDKPSYSFSRAVHDMSPYKLKDLGDKVVLVHNIVGVNEDDISVEVADNGGRTQLIISGTTHNDILNYDYKVNFKSVSYEVKEGLLYIYLYKKEQEVKALPVTKM